MSNANNVNGELTYLPIEQLFPHLDNPRRDVGDVSELADSIKAKGIMQNLTVVKGHTITHDEWVDLSRDYSKNPTEKVRDKMNSRKSEDGYTVIIGHRRLAAAKMAGLTKLPCVIVEMEPREQVATMLLENMQRSDLTNFEQAQGFQMMLDLGETQSSIAEQTGFSKTTVSRRLKLLKLDKEKFRSAESRGGTLEDYIKAAEIEDEKERNKVTDAIGTSNFSWVLKEAMKKQEINKAMPVIKAEMKKIGAKRDNNISPWDGKHEEVFSIKASDFKEGCMPKKVKKGTDYWWNIMYSDEVHLYKIKAKPKKEVVKKSDAELRAIAQRKKLAAITEKAYECRKAFVLEFSACKKDKDILNEWLWELIYRKLSGNYSRDTNWELLCEKIDEPFERYKYQCERKNLDKYLNSDPSNSPIVLLLAMSGDTKQAGYYTERYGEIMPEHMENHTLNMVYEYLCRLGYGMSDEEKALQNGTHELFAKPEQTDK